MSRYSLYFNEAVAGQIYQSDPRDIISLPAVVQTPLVNVSHGPILFGYPVVYLNYSYPNFTEIGVAITSDPEENNFIGISVFSHNCEIEDSNVSEVLDIGAAYFDKDIVSVLTKGKIWVRLANGANVKTGDKAYIFNSEANGGQPQDAFIVFTNAAARNNIEIGLFVTDKNAQNLAVLQFDLSANKAIL